MKARVPAAFCLAALLFCCWSIYHGKAVRHEADEASVEITVTGPDGIVIPVVRRAEK